MPPTVNQGVHLTLSRKLRRLGSRLQESQWRRYGMVLLAGKVLGVAAVMLIACFVTELCFTTVLAADTPAVKAADIVNPVNTMWTLVAAFLVFGMQVGSSDRRRTQNSLMASMSWRMRPKLWSAWKAMRHISSASLSVTSSRVG